MDTIKDNKLSDIKEKSVTVSPFGDNKACTFAYQKAERISIAIHLITNFVPEREPIRRALRDKSISILSDILGLRSGLRSAGSENVNDVIAKLYEITSLLTVVRSSGYISLMNLSIIKEECNNLCSFLREVEDMDGSESLGLPKTFFEVKDTVIDKGQIIGTPQTSLRKSVSQKVQTPAKSIRTLKQHSSRRETILKLLKDTPKINVKDVASEIPGCSEKTLQRELMSMVSDGILVKEGERRWSTYLLAS